MGFNSAFKGLNLTIIECKKNLGVNGIRILKKYQNEMSRKLCMGFNNCRTRKTNTGLVWTWWCGGICNYWSYTGWSVL